MIKRRREERTGGCEFGGTCDATALAGPELCEDRLPQNLQFHSINHYPFNSLNLVDFLLLIFQQFLLPVTVTRHSIPTSAHLWLPPCFAVFHCFTQKNNSPNCFSLRSDKDTSPLLYL